MAAKVIRSVKQLGALTVVAVAVPVTGSYVYRLQVAQPENKEPSMMKVSELPLYGNPEKGFKVLPEEIGLVRGAVSSAREGVWNFLEQINYKDKKERAKEIAETGVAHTQSTVEYIRTETGTIQRIGIITLSGLGGIILGYRGGYMRKAAFGTFGALAAASICYPKETIDLTRDSYNNMAESLGVDLPGSKASKDKQNKS